MLRSSLCEVKKFRNPLKTKQTKKQDHITFDFDPIFENQVLLHEKVNRKILVEHNQHIKMVTPFLSEKISN